MRAIWNDTIVAESDATVVVEGNHYFPPESIRPEYFRESAHSTHCPWKGRASYATLEVEGAVNENAAWCYAEPKDGARQIAGRYAFWKGVQVTE